MKIKWNWGTGILIGIIVFMTFIIGLVFVSFKQNFDLVEKDYYPKALEYQQQIDKESNAHNLKKQVTIENTGEQIILTFQSFRNTAVIIIHQLPEKILFRPRAAIHVPAGRNQGTCRQGSQKGKRHKTSGFNKVPSFHM